MDPSIHAKVLSGTREEAPPSSRFEPAADEAREIMRLVEARVVYVKGQVLSAISQFLGESSLEARASSATLPKRSSADDLEQFAPAWGPLLEAARTDVLAALAWHLTQERGVDLGDRPLLCQALGLTRPEILEALQALAADPPTVRLNGHADAETASHHATTVPAHAPSVVAMARQAEWLRLGKGHVLCEQGAPSDCMYAVISGRLRAVVSESKGSPRAVADLGKGQTIGEMGLLTGEPRSATVIAVRDCEIVKLSKAVFDDVVVQHPRALLWLTRDLAQRLRQSTAFDDRRRPS
jgi:CRP-like cAMP-binding protein